MNLNYFEGGHSFLEMTLRASAITTQINRASSNLKMFCASKDTNKQKNEKAIKISNSPNNEL